jgi:cupin fold WbuC family metalloprotein
VCAHPNAAAEQHDMLIVSRSETYVAPHRHPAKTETCLVIEGEADALLFDEQGQLADLLAMGPAGSGRPFFYRMPANRFHSLVIRSEALVFVESTKGPFRAEDTEFASWAPGSERTEAGRSYLSATVDRYRVSRGRRF